MAAEGLHNVVTPMPMLWLIVVVVDFIEENKNPMRATGEDENKIKFEINH